MLSKPIWPWYFLAAGLLSVVSVVTGGCRRGDGLNRVVVSGAVKLDGKPVEDGQIRYIPVGDTQGPVSVSRIEHGQYVCQDFGGVPAGEHRVEILVWDPNIPHPSGPGLPPRPQWAPEKYNKNSELVATVDASRDMKATDWNLQSAVK
ncbi:MAG: hypothetical protein WD468_08075 [Pirellulales bacterium]